MRRRWDFALVYLYFLKWLYQAICYLFFLKKKLFFAKIPGVLPYKKLMGICHWMGSHFRDWIDYNGIAFSVEFLEWGRTFSDFLG